MGLFYNGSDDGLLTDARLRRAIFGYGLPNRFEDRRHQEARAFIKQMGLPLREK